MIYSLPIWHYGFCLASKKETKHKQQNLLPHGFGISFPFFQCSLTDRANSSSLIAEASTHYLFRLCVIWVNLFRCMWKIWKNKESKGKKAWGMRPRSNLQAAMKFYSFALALSVFFQVTVCMCDHSFYCVCVFVCLRLKMYVTFFVSVCSTNIQFAVQKKLPKTLSH